MSSAESPTVDGPNGPLVGDAEQLYRCIMYPAWWVEEEGRISSFAFKFPYFSVDVASLAGSSDATLSRFRPGTGLVSFPCRVAKELGCDVRLEPDPRYPDNRARSRLHGHGEAQDDSAKTYGGMHSSSQTKFWLGLLTNVSTATQQVVSKAWNFAHVLQDDGLSYMAYVEQITFPLFLKMADEHTKPPYNRKPIVPAGHDWASLLSKEGDALETQYRHVLEKLSTQPGMLGEVFKKAKPEIQNPVTLRRLVVDLIEPEKWMSMQADVKGDIYEGLLAKKSAAESPKGAGQYYPGK